MRTTRVIFPPLKALAAFITHTKAVSLRQILASYPKAKVILCLPEPEDYCKGVMSVRKSAERKKGWLEHLDDIVKWFLSVLAWGGRLVIETFECYGTQGK